MSNKKFAKQYPQAHLTENPQISLVDEPTNPNAQVIPAESSDEIVLTQVQVEPSTPEPARKVKVWNTSLLNIREQPSVTSNVVAVVALGSVFRVLDNIGDWTKVESVDLGQMVVGYALTKYLGAT